MVRPSRTPVRTRARRDETAHQIASTYQKLGVSSRRELQELPMSPQELPMERSAVERY
jgi:hypothetical protein